MAFFQKIKKLFKKKPPKTSSLARQFVSELNLQRGYIKLEGDILPCLYCTNNRDAFYYYNTPEAFYYYDNPVASAPESEAWERVPVVDTTKMPYPQPIMGTKMPEKFRRRSKSFV